MKVTEEMIFEKVKNGLVTIDNITNDFKKDLENNKGGIYVLYNSDDDVLYVGMTSFAKTSNLFQRLYGNGNAAHCKKTWFNEIKNIKFYQMNKINGHDMKFDIMIVERIMIRKLQPKYNDLFYTESEIKAAYDAL